MDTIALVPVAQSYGANIDSIDPAGAAAGLYSWETPAVTGDVADDNDDTYLALASYLDAAGMYHIDTVACDFQLAAGAPVACYVQIRAKNDPDVLTDPPPESTREVWAQLSSTTDGTVYGSRNSTRPATLPLLDLTATTMAEFDFWWGGAPDPTNPTDPGNWFEFAVDEMAPGSADALTGGGLRLTLGFFHVADGTHVSRTWVAMAEVRLVVALAASTGFPLQAPCRLYPRDDDLGVGAGHVWPPPRPDMPGGYV